MKGDRALVVMARYPEVGKVKTRLAGACGAEAATTLYRAFIADLDRRFATGPRRLVWAYDPPSAPFSRLVASSARCIPQVGVDLGARMDACFRALCDEFESVVMIGADVPHVRSSWMAEAEERLQDVDVVLGPSRDGGYCLVAMRVAHNLFTDVTMSTSHVLADTQRKIGGLGLRLHLLQPSFDIDETGDLDRLRNELKKDVDLQTQLPATAAWLACHADPH